MPASQAQILANRANASKSTGPKSAEGKAVSRGNALTHGLTASTIMPEREAAEVERRTAAFVAELHPSGEIGAVLARHAARMSVRMERCAEHENAVMANNVRQALADFEPPDGVSDPTELAKLRLEVERRAVFEESDAASLARKYEAAAERGFFRALKELRQHEQQMKAAQAKALEEKLGSFLPGEMTDEEFDTWHAETISAEVGTGCSNPVTRSGQTRTERDACRSSEKLEPTSPADRGQGSPIGNFGFSIGKSPNVKVS